MAQILTMASLSGMGVAFVLAVIVVASDIQSAIKAQLGSLANTFVLAVWQGWIVVLGWGLVVAAIFQVIINHPDWAKSTFNFDVSENTLLAGIAVGISAIVVIRSKLMKIGNIEIGGEWAYLWSRAFVLKAVNQVRFEIRVTGEKLYKPAAEDLIKYPTFFTDLERWIVENIKGYEPTLAAKISAQINEVKKQAKAFPDQDVNARTYLVGIALDFMSPGELKSWAQVYKIT
jgi:hypothetical protein